MILTQSISCCPWWARSTFSSSSSPLSHSSSCFLLLAFHSRERDEGNRQSEWSWGSGVGIFLHFELTCGPCWFNGERSFLILFEVAAFLSDDPIVAAGCLVGYCLLILSFGIWSFQAKGHMDVHNHFSYSWLPWRPKLGPLSDIFLYWTFDWLWLTRRVRAYKVTELVSLQRLRASSPGHHHLAPLLDEKDIRWQIYSKKDHDNI
jgi:hypothetical protein